MWDFLYSKLGFTGVYMFYLCSKTMIRNKYEGCSNMNANIFIIFKKSDFFLSKLLAEKKYNPVSISSKQARL